MKTLTEADIRRQLGETQVLGRSILCLTEVDSTNELAKSMARQGAEEGLVLLAERQTAGKGRLGRSFASPAGQGIWMSLLLRPTCSPDRLPPVTALTAAACRLAIREVCGTEVGIKWPNDLVLRERKLCGILTELESSGEGLALVIGIGLNVCQRPEDFPPELRETAVSLEMALGQPVDRAALAAAMLRQLDAMYQSLLAGDLDAWRESYRAGCVNLGREVRILWPDGRQEAAHALDVDGDFGLLVRRQDGSVTPLRSGEVSVRGLYGYTEGNPPLR